MTEFSGGPFKAPSYMMEGYLNMSESDWSEKSLARKAKREASKSYVSLPCSYVDVSPLPLIQARQRSASQPQRGTGGSPTPSFVDLVRDLNVNLSEGFCWVTSRFHISSVNPLRAENVRVRGEAPASPSDVCTL